MFKTSTVRAAIMCSVIAAISATGGQAFAEEGRLGYLTQTHGVIDREPPGQVSCQQGAAILRRKGFERVEPFDCAGILYRFSVRKNDRNMTVLMNADSAGYVELY